MLEPTTATARSDAPPTVFISAAEPSADLHGANLIRAVNRLDPDVRFVGVAGPLMREAGCAGIFDMTAHAAMGGGILKVVPQALSMLRACRNYLHSHRVDLVVPIDSPMLNLGVARHGKRAGVPVLYYIAPQVWAWARSRVRRVRRRVDRLAVILPFEEAFFREYDIPAEYVGHPLFDTLASREIDPADIEALRAQGRPVVAIMPGSRKHVTEEVFPGQLEVAAAIRAQHPEVHFAISVANERTAPIIERILADCDLPYSLHHRANGLVLQAADLALVASGTATLEVAYYHTSMVVMYNGTRFGYYVFGKWVISIPHLSLVNILAGRELVPEFMPFYNSTEPIKAQALDILGNPERARQMRADIGAMIDPLIKTGASENAARILLEMLEDSAAGRGRGGERAKAGGKRD